MEILVVIAIISILSAVLYVNVSQGSAQARDAQRQADMRTMEVAIELYNNKYGRYPAGCNGPNRWSGETTASACPSGNEYIVGLAPEFMQRLLYDPKLNGSNSGYAYLTNADGSVYKLIAFNTVETERVDYTHEFKICDTDNTASVEPICAQVRSFGNSRPPHCNQTNPSFQTSYAVWGGFAAANINARIGSVVYNRQVEERTEDIVCVIP